MEFESIHDTEIGFPEGPEAAGEPERTGTPPLQVPAGTGGPGRPNGAGIPGVSVETPPREARLQADLRAFAAAFPDAARDPRSSPGEVWAMARRGGSLTAAYGAWSEAVRRNAENAARSAGSMRSAGAGPGPVDPFLEGWNE